MPKNKTLYVRDSDPVVWDEAKRMLVFYQRKSLGLFLTEMVQPPSKGASSTRRPTSGVGF
jgi:hypothetical protein